MSSRNNATSAFLPYPVPDQQQTQALTTSPLQPEPNLCTPPHPSPYTGALAPAGTPPDAEFGTAPLATRTSLTSKALNHSTI